jgi:hypothetical protein
MINALFIAVIGMKSKMAKSARNHSLEFFNDLTDRTRMNSKVSEKCLASKSKVWPNLRSQIKLIDVNV